MYNYKNKGSIWILAILIIIIFILLVMVQADKKFVLDEIDFPIVSKATSETGYPIYYRGEMNPEHIGLYHPPLYIYLQALFIRLLGYSEITIRAFGMLCAILTAFLSVMVVKLLIFNNEKYKMVEQHFYLVFMALFLWHPYTIACATLPDIDTTILPVTFALFIFFATKYSRKMELEKANFVSFLKNNLKELIVLVLMFTLLLWSKLTISLLAPLLLFSLFYFYSYKLKGSIIVTFIVTALGCILFLITFKAYTVLFDLPFDYTFRFLFESFIKGTASETSNYIATVYNIIRNLSYAIYFLNWLTMPTFLLLSLGLLYLFKKNANMGSSNHRQLLVITIFSLFIILFYFGLIAPFGGFFKYIIVVMPYLFIPFILFYSNLKLEYKQSNVSIIYIIALILGFLINTFLIRDNPIKHSTPVSFYTVLAVLLICIVFIYLLGGKNTKLTSVTIWINIILLVTIGYQLSLSRIQAISNYPTKYNYGLAGFEETVEYLRANTEKDEVIWAMKDIGYYTNNKYIESYSFFFNEALQRELVDIIEKGDVRYYVVTQGVGQDRVDAYPEIGAVLDSYTNKEIELGNYLIYKIKE